MRSPTNNEPAFCGYIVAGATHELRNVLAVIKEYSGLLEDIASGGPQALAERHERIERALDSISGQLLRGQEHLGQLNRFAHCADEDRANMAASEVVELLMFLTKRFVSQKLVEQEMVIETDATIRGDLIRLLMALHAAQEAVLAALPDGGRLVLTVRQSGDGAEIEMQPVGDGSGVVGELDSVVEALDATGGRVEVDAQGVVRMVLPVVS